jgi:RNA polymerase sigma-70 factor (ECF subfamily)
MAKAQRKEWIEGILETYEQRLVAYTYRLVRDLDQAREIVQDTFLKLCNAERASVEGHEREWLYTVCRNAALDVLRKRHPTMQLEDGVQENSLVRLYALVPETPSKVVERNIQMSRVLSLLEELNEDQKEVIRLKFQDELSYAEISQITGHSVSNVGFLIHAGMKKVRERLRQQREGSYGGQ